MKRRLLTFIVWLFSMAAFAQQGDVMLCEGFYTPWLEEGWDAKGDDWVVWYVSNTTFAGGKSHEMQIGKPRKNHLQGVQFANRI